MFFTEVNQTSFHRVRSISDVQPQFLYVNALSEMFEEKTEWIEAATFMHFIPTSNNFDDTARMFLALEKYPRKMVCINDNIDYDRKRDFSHTVDLWGKTTTLITLLAKV